MQSKLYEMTESSVYLANSHMTCCFIMGCDPCTRNADKLHIAKFSFFVFPEMNCFRQPEK